MSEDPIERALDAIRNMNARHIEFQNAVMLARDVAKIGTEATNKKAWALIDEALERLITL